MGGRYHQRDVILKEGPVFDLFAAGFLAENCNVTTPVAYLVDGTSRRANTYVYVHAGMLLMKASEEMGEGISSSGRAARDL
jgi:hypothetical protein